MHTFHNPLSTRGRCPPGGFLSPIKARGRADTSDQGGFCDAQQTHKQISTNAGFNRKKKNPFKNQLN